MKEIDKYEHVAKNIVCKITPDLRESHNFISGLATYLREQFPEPVKIEGVRELVDKVRDSTTCRGGGERYHLNDNEAEHLMTDFINAREAGKWISVMERLPEKLVSVWVSDKKNEQYINMLEKSGEWFYKSGIVTHWQPLPTAPNGREG